MSDYRDSALPTTHWAIYRRRSLPGKSEWTRTGRTTIRSLAVRYAAQPNTRVFEITSTEVFRPIHEEE